MSEHKPSLRIFLIEHAEGRVSGYLMRHRVGFFDAPPPSAYGFDADEVRRSLEAQLEERLATGREDLERYLFSEAFGVRVAKLSVLPASRVETQSVVSTREIPLRLPYAWSKLESGAYRIMLPRFDWWMLLEELTDAPAALRVAVGAALLGEESVWITEFEQLGRVSVVSFEPSELARARSRAKRSVHVDEAAARRARFPIASEVCEEWVSRAATGRMPRLFGAQPAVDQLIATLDLHPRPSLLIVGEGGVGKTSLVARFARELLRRQRDRREPGPRIWSTDADRLIAGMVYLGQWQERCLKLSEELSDEGDFLYVGSLSSFLRERSGGSSIGDLFAPGALDGSLPLIAECTPSEREWARRQNATLVDAMDVIELSEMPRAHVARLISRYTARSTPATAGGRPSAQLHPDAVNRLVHHLGAFRRDQRFPGKAIRFLEWLETDPTRPQRLYPSDLSAAYSRFSGLPLDILADERKAGVAEVAASLRERVIGQDEACEACARVIVPFKAGLQDPERPLGSLLFVGPTGVGKTELAKQLARYLFGDPRRLIRLDMSEFMVRGAAQRMLEVGPGVTSLAQRVREQPLSLILFDEIEKAHPEAFDVLLGLLGEGRLTDSRGDLVDFRMTIVIMTSNLGVKERAAAGFGGQLETDFRRGARAYFRPEFWNRLDHIVSFRHLAAEDVRRIVDLELASLRDRPGMKERDVSLRVTDAARDTLAARGYDAKRGARPLQRVIEEQVVTPMAVVLAENPAAQGVTFRVRMSDDALVEGALDVVLG